jgi:branched-chain amino acid aminotransferase
MDLAKSAGIRVAETNLTRQDVYVADECFLTGTGAEVIPVTSIDKRNIGSGKVGPMTLKLMQAFHVLVREG